MDIQLNTLYVFTAGSYIHRDHRNVVVEFEKKVKASIPIHHLDAVAVFGPSMVSPGAMELCHEQGVSLTFLSDSGRVVARVDAPMSGNVLVRREQFRRADRPEACAALARAFVAGKLQNARHTLLRAGRDTDDTEAPAELQRAASLIGQHLESLPNTPDVDARPRPRGRFRPGLLRGLPPTHPSLPRDDFPMNGRSRRPPLDRVNALLVIRLRLDDTRLCLRPDRRRARPGRRLPARRPPGPAEPRARPGRGVPHVDRGSPRTGPDQPSATRLRRLSSTATAAPSRLPPTAERRLCKRTSRESARR